MEKCIKCGKPIEQKSKDFIVDTCNECWKKGIGVTVNTEFEKLLIRSKELGFH